MAMSEVIIDPETGVVSLASGLELQPFGGVPTSWPAPLTLRDVWDVENGYFWHYVEGAQFASEACEVQVCSFKNSIEQVLFKFVWESQKPLYDNQIEVERQIRQGRKGLSALLDRSFVTGREDFSWGSALSVYDDRSGGIPRIGVFYDP